MPHDTRTSGCILSRLLASHGSIPRWQMSGAPDPAMLAVIFRQQYADQAGRLCNNAGWREIATGLTEDELRAKQSPSNMFMNVKSFCSVTALSTFVLTQTQAISRCSIGVFAGGAFGNVCWALASLFRRLFAGYVSPVVTSLYDLPPVLPTPVNEEVASSACVAVSTGFR